jgi:copper ion binding protein
METINGREQLARITIPVTGMTCASCVRRVERALSKQKGVAEASVNFAAEKASVTYESAATSPEELIGAIQDAGYGADVRDTTFGVTGMTCASCVRRVERALEKVPGVLEANLNLATEKATVGYIAGVVEPRDLERAVEDAGYGVVREDESSTEDSHEREYGKLKRDFLLAAALTALILLGSLPHMFGFMLPIPAGLLNFGLLLLATPVQFWAGWRFYRGAWGALKHGQANMNTLVVMGTSAASEQLADQARRQQEAGQAFAQESVKAYMDFLDTAFSQYREGTQRAAGSAQEGARAGAQAVADVVDIAAGATQDTADIAAGATRATAQIAAGQPPIDGYDEMNVEEVTSRLDGLSEAELMRVRTYEQGNKNRETLITQIDRRLEATT